MNLRIRRPSPTPDPPVAPQLRSGYYRDPSRLNGGSATSPLVWIFVALAVLADLAAFYSVVAVLFRSQPVIVWLATIGFTAVGVGLAHQLGVGFKQRRGADPRASAIVWGSLFAWLGLGVAAFVVRWLSAPISAMVDAGASFPAAGGASAAPGVDRSLLAAVFFIVLFVASGLLAGFVGYQGYNPDVIALGRARDLRQVAARRREASVAGLAELRAVRDALMTELERADEHRAAMRQTTAASVYELKNRARLMLAIRNGDANEAQDIIDDAPRPPTAWSRAVGEDRP
jgi:hypothetical protein